MAVQSGVRSEIYGSMKDNWGAMLGLGALIMILGLIALSISVFTTMVSVVVLGLLVIAAGISEVVYAASGRTQTHAALHFFMGILYVVAGFIMTFWPMASALTLTLFIAFLLMASGIFRLGAAFVYRDSNWGWAAFSGLLSLVLGIMIFNRWPSSGLWVIGMFIGVDLLVLGASLVSASFKARRELPSSTRRPLHA